MVVYYTGAGVVPKGRHRQRKANFTTIVMHGATIYEFAWKRGYAESRSVFPIKISFEVHLMRMAAIMWSILRKQNM